MATRPEDGPDKVPPMEGYLFVGALVAILIAWSRHFHAWSNSPAARRSRRPLSAAVSTTAAAGLFLISGVIGFNIRALPSATPIWANSVIWWEVVVGVVLLPVAIYLWRLGVRDIDA